MKQLDLENQLRDVVSRIIVQVELATAQGRTDINLALEDAFLPILTSAYNLPHLVNLNRKQRNYPGIDLGDDHDRVAFQITSTTSLDKVKATVGQFMDRKYYSTFDELFILMLVRKQGSYSQTSVNELLDENFSFNCKKHIIDLVDLTGKITTLRPAAQERALNELKYILGEVDAYISFSTETVPASKMITSNLQHIELPEKIYVAELLIDEKDVVNRSQAELGYKGKARSKRSIVKMALLLNGEGSDAWVCYDRRLFSFHNIEQCDLCSVVDIGTIEQLEISDLITETEPDNVNILKQMLFAEIQERLKRHHVRTHAKDRFFFFGPLQEHDKERKETWVGKRTAVRRVYEVKQQKKDPEKVAHHQHLSFDLTFTQIEHSWYAQIVPSWYYSYNGYVQSNWHDNLLSTQKRQEFNPAVRDAVRFIAYFLAKSDEGETCGLRFGSLVTFDVSDSAELHDDTDDDDLMDEAAA